jgi:hypothetical protein
MLIGDTERESQRERFETYVVKFCGEEDGPTTPRAFATLL